MAHTTVARPTDHVETIKGSRFLARVASVADVAAAERLLADARAEFPDAHHHCSAWRVGSALAANDDGEPGGTAGRPMLEVLLKRELDHVAVVCVRWFGGTKLGAGGLVRAYGGTVAKALDDAGERFVPDRVRAVARLPYARLDVVHRLLDDWPGARKGDATFGADGAVLPFVALASDLEDLRRRLADVSSGEVEVEVVSSDPAALLDDGTGT